MSDRPTFEERLADPLGHFPYKLDEAHAGVEREVRRQVNALELHDAQVQDSLTTALVDLAAGVVDATAAYVAAQEAYLRGPSDETRRAEREAANALTVERRDRRAARDWLIADARNQDAAIRAQNQKG
jgi:hypothetical protein